MWDSRPRLSSRANPGKLVWVGHSCPTPLTLILLCRFSLSPRPIPTPLHQLQNPLMQHAFSLSSRAACRSSPSSSNTLPSTLYSPSTERLFDILLFLAFGFQHPKAPTRNSSPVGGSPPAQRNADTTVPHFSHLVPGVPSVPQARQTGNMRN